MAKIHFFYSTMNAGKSTALLQSNHNYKENGMDTMLFIPKADAEKNHGYIESRIGLKSEEMNFFLKQLEDKLINEHVKPLKNKHKNLQQKNIY